MREFKLLIGQVTRLEEDVVEARRLAERAEWALQSMLMRNCPERAE